MTALPSVAVDTSSPVPPYEQLRVQLVELIRAGVLAPDDRLPPLRQLAADLGLAVGTAARAYKELEAAGLVRSRRGAGTRVVGRAPALARSERDRLLHAATVAYVRQAWRLGAAAGDILDAVAEVLDRPAELPAR
jgi:DNA-binding transcriptional regulator YhcF (GntR family)